MAHPPRLDERATAAGPVRGRRAQRVSHELWISDERAPFSTTDLAVLTAVAARARHPPARRAGLAHPAGARRRSLHAPLPLTSLRAGTSTAPMRAMQSAWTRRLGEARSPDGAAAEQLTRTRPV